MTVTNADSEQVLLALLDIDWKGTRIKAICGKVVTVETGGVDRHFEFDSIEAAEAAFRSKVAQ
jgi:hypothetical protein